MAEKAVPHDKYRTHPNKAAKLFGVHRRTIFRWIKRENLDYHEGMLNTAQIEKNFELWQKSIPKGDAAKKLKVMIATVSSWVKKGLLVEVIVFGQRRITLQSIRKVMAMPTYNPGCKKVLLNNGIERKTELGLLVIYKPVSAKVKKLIGSRRFATKESVSRFLGININKIDSLGIRGELIGEEFLFYAHSVEAYKKTDRNKFYKEEPSRRR